MAKTTKTNETENNTGRTPDFIAYAVIDRPGTEGKARWRELGTAWKHNDGNGLQLRLDALPVDGVITLRVPLPPKAD